MKLPSASGNSSQNPPNGLLQHWPGTAAAAGAQTNPAAISAAATAIFCRNIINPPINTSMLVHINGIPTHRHFGLDELEAAKQRAAG